MSKTTRFCNSSSGIGAATAGGVPLTRADLGSVVVCLEVRNADFRFGVERSS